MKYADGQEAKLGDVVEIGGDIHGTVVVLVREGLAADGFVPDDWSYLQEGILVESRQTGLVHYPEKFNDHLLLTSRATERLAP